MRVLGMLMLMLAPCATAYAVAHLADAFRLVQGLVERWRPAPMRPVGPPIQRVAADLHRISARLDALGAAGPIPGRIVRVQATTAAYDDVLLQACRALEVEPAGARSPLSSAQRLQTEAALVGAGLRW